MEVTNIEHTKQKYDVRLPLDQFVSEKGCSRKVTTNAWPRQAPTASGDVPFGLGIEVQDWATTLSGIRMAASTKFIMTRVLGARTYWKK